MPIEVRLSQIAESMTSAPTPAAAQSIGATPLAASMARLAELDLSTVQSTGTDDRITKADVEAALRNQRSAGVAMDAHVEAVPADSGVENVRTAGLRVVGGAR